MPPRPNVPYSPVGDVAPEVRAPFDYLTVRATPQQFGSDVGTAFEKSGQILGRVGQEAEQTALEFQQLNNETTVYTAMAQGSQQQGDLETNLRQLRGMNAVNARGEYQQKLMDIQNNLAESMPNPAAKAAFLQRFSRYTAMTDRSMGFYIGDQAQAAHIEALNATLDAAQSRIVKNSGIGDVAPDFHDIVSASSQLGAAQGLPKEAVDNLIQSKTGDAVMNVIRARIATGHLDQAAQIFHQFLSMPVPGTGTITQQKQPVPLSLIKQLEASGETAVSPKGAVGVNQVEPATAQQYGFDPSRLKDRDYNDKVASAILDDLNKRYGNDQDAVLIAYNAGPKVANRWIASGRNMAILPKETQSYLTKANDLSPPQAPTGEQDTGLPMLDGKHIAQIQGELTYASLAADRRASEDSSKMRVSINHSINNIQDMIVSGFTAPDSLFPSRDQVDEAFANQPELADEAWEKIQDLKNVNSYTAMLQGATPEQVAQIRATLAPDPSKPNTFAVQKRLADSFDTALQNRQKALNADPVAYFQKTDSALSGQFAAALTHPELFGSYAQTMLGKENAVGLGPQQYRLLPKSVSEQISQKITSDPAAAPAAMQSLEKQFGTFWPQVWRDISTDGKLPVAFQAVGVLKDQHQATLLARGLSEGGKNGKDIGDLIPKFEKTKIDDQIDDQTGPLFSLVHSFSSTVGSTEMQVGTLSAAKTLAYSEMVYDGVTDPNTAASKAIKAFTDQFDFSLPGGPRVPSDKSATVSSSASKLIASLNLNNISIPEKFGSQGWPTKDEYVDLVKSSPHWITSPQADAIFLMDPYGRMVRDTGGQPISVPFSSAGLTGR